MTRNILWKLDCHILPPLALLWLANFIDRSNVGNARIAGLESDIHLHGNQFNTTLAVFYITYILVELPSNWVLKRMKANRWLPFLVFVWGIVTTLTALVQNLGGLVGIRMCLGICEGGLLPGIVLYLSTMYKRHELQLRIGIFYASASLSGAFGGLLATAIIKMDGIGNLVGWRWIFILEGIATIIFSIIAAIFLPADVSSASFLSEEERDFALSRLHSDDFVVNMTSKSDPMPEASALHEPKVDMITVEKVQISARSRMEREEEIFEWREVIRGLTDIQTWLTAIAYLGFDVSLYSYSLFLPSIVAQLGYSGGRAQLHTVPPYVPATVLTVVVAFLSDRLKWRGPFILIFLPVAIIGYTVAITAKTNMGRYAAVFLIAAGVYISIGLEPVCLLMSQCYSYPSGPCLLSILPNNSSGHYKRATTTALQLALANTGGFIATFSYTQDQAPRYIRGHAINLACLVLAWFFIGANVCYCLWENKARREGRRAENIRKYKELWDEGTRAPIGDRHPDFRFTL
ncbi:MFS transporter [Guyanagaster necrorhizus]|uniref:MFS transporter n=1 Tax=Guyanagaster necrorhizus TaxID=856835 RepID=A0A9P7VZ42_9AGAR|nr:MFS transporter [Guyanagaster necrorhizus MCA 3950]KAG7449228.1 MFS transporter [Guyanagaster necrorhizus MCA 3950]